MEKVGKPKLVFFQWKHERLPKFLLLHMQQHVKCLSEFFDVILINEDCDYQQICDLYQPDLALFESGYRSSISQRLKITNTSTHPQIPKLGFHNADAWCDWRTGFLSDMEHWGIETFFSICTTTPEHTPEIAENMFVWPNFIDADVYRDYGESKVVEVLINGCVNLLYPWREKIFNILTDRYPSLVFQHSGYDSSSSQMIYGEQYARTLNASFFVPACGTVAKDVVRKHFEIPGSRSCLIAEKTPSVEAAGFVDMQNCVFADESDILDKLDYLFKNPDELARITDSGYQLVHSQHTLKQRDQILQWFNLHKHLKPNQKIVQTNPFGDLTVVDKSSGIESSHIICNGAHLVALRQGDEKLWAEKYDEAESLYLKCLNYIHWMREPKLKLALCSLYKGTPKRSLELLVELVNVDLMHSQVLDPDPIEWAYLIISLLCQGKLNEAIIRAEQFPLLCHPELERTRWVVNVLQNKRDIIPPSAERSPKSRRSVHQMPSLNLADWVDRLAIVLRSCQQLKLAEQLHGLSIRGDEVIETPKINSNNVTEIWRNQRLLIHLNRLKTLDYLFNQLSIPPRPSLPPISELDYAIRLARAVKKIIIRFPERLKNAFTSGRSLTTKVMMK
ncbi:MAG: glycosyltransferase [Cyanosarcina radialis HA8281-LM2]|nr:glycosyltransferase [Cyanosarcina radialis HA8281-LM2]